MLVVISDLHLNDGTAAPPNVPAEAFAHWWLDVLDLAEQKEVKEIEVLFLGDIFDLIRTEHWFYPAAGEALPAPKTGAPPPREEFPISGRPWGDPSINERPDQLSMECRERALAIAQRITVTAPDQLALLRGDLPALSAEFRARAGNATAIDDMQAHVTRLTSRGLLVKRYYIPGNHDRLCRVIPEVESCVMAALGAGPPPGSPHRYCSPTYGVLARHGHEWDPFNFEKYTARQDPDSWTDADYQLVPIGDPITTELASRMPFEMFHALRDLVESGAVTKRERQAIYEHLKQIEDVRPLSAALSWILVEGHRLGEQYPSPQREQIVDALQRVVREVMASFMSLPFVAGWLKKHDSWGLGFDEADILQDVYRAVRMIRLRPVTRLSPSIEKLTRAWARATRSSDHYADAAATERELLASSGGEIRYCVYGHTHSYRHEALTCEVDGDERVYFNSGTWRPRVYQARDGSGFLGVKEMTYLVFYSADEDPLPGPPAFESPAPVGLLSGTRRRDPARAPGKSPAKGTSYETWNGVLLKRRRG